MSGGERATVVGCQAVNIQYNNSGVSSSEHATAVVSGSEVVTAVVSIIEHATAVVSSSEHATAVDCQAVNLQQQWSVKW